MKRKLKQRLLRSRKLRKLLLSGFGILLLLIGLDAHADGRIQRNTYMSQIDISGKTADEIQPLIESFLDKPITMRIKQRDYAFTPREMGIGLDKPTLTKFLAEESGGLFPENLIKLLLSGREKRIVPLPLFFSPHYDTFIENTLFDFGSTNDSVVVDPKEKELVYRDNDRSYKLESGNLKALIVHAFGTGETIEPFLLKQNTEKKVTVAYYNETLRTIFHRPVFVFVDVPDSPSGQLSFTVDDDQLKRITDVTIPEDGSDITIDINSAILTDIIQQHIIELPIPPHTSVSMKAVKEEVQKLLEKRITGIAINDIHVGLDDGPNTTGDIASKYIEVDISQQRMYLFENGNLIRTYQISSGKFYPTPVGTFTVLNKSPIAFSNIYTVWMPFWMAFWFSEESNAFYGIHELPFAAAEDGSQTSDQQGSVGLPSTGGCVALATGDAEEVYVFADIGTPIHIYN